MDTRPFRERLTSRRFLLTLATTVLAVVLDISAETAALVIGGVVGSYNLKDLAAKPTSTDG